jgi:A/G-specific adenine glycosylase
MVSRTGTRVAPVARGARPVSRARERVHAAANAGRTGRRGLRTLSRDVSLVLGAGARVTRRRRARVERARLQYARGTAARGRPRESEALRALPGIGAYTAGAIRVFAFGLDDVAVDVNVRRVVHRLCFGIEHPPLASANEIDATARGLLPQGDAHDWNSALMDLGAMLCTARAPACERCPVRSWCAAAPAGQARIAGAAKMQRRKGRSGPQASLPFQATRRFIRGRVLDRLRELEAGALLPLAEIESTYPLEEIVGGLERDGLVVREAGGIRLR